jgi:hypothetical protein
MLGDLTQYMGDFKFVSTLSMSWIVVSSKSLFFSIGYNYPAIALGLAHNLL